MEEKKIYTDCEVFEQIKDGSRKQYIKLWQDFKTFTVGHNFEDSQPGEENFITFFKHMRLEKKMATSTLWTHYSMLNSVMKRKYGSKIQDFPRVTMLIKGFPEDLKHKALVLDEEDLKKFWSLKMDTAYWEVRKAIAITAVFGGLRMIECLNLELEKINRGPEGYTITHSRAKQRSDKMNTKFVVPQEGGFADILAIYLEKVKTRLGKYTGKVWYTGKKSATLTCQPMGRNMVFKVPHEIAELLGLPNPASYTFHSFRRTSATIAADSGSTTEQMVDFYGWKNSSMCKEYISSSKPAILVMANRLAGSGQKALGQQEESNTLGQQEDRNFLAQHMDDYDYANMEEDQEMCRNAGIPFTTSTCQHGMQETSMQNSMVESSIKTALKALPQNNGAKIDLKVIVVNNMSGNIF